MTSKKLSLIMGGRDQIERDLVNALFGIDITEIERLSALLDSIEKKSKPFLELIRFELNEAASYRTTEFDRMIF